MGGIGESSLDETHTCESNAKLAWKRIAWLRHALRPERAVESPLGETIGQRGQLALVHNQGQESEPTRRFAQDCSRQTTLSLDAGVQAHIDATRKTTQAMVRR